MRSLADRIAPLLAFLLPLASYLPTMARGLVWGDGIELAAVCATLGIAHPTGYPLFTLVGHLFTRLPFGTVAFRVTLFCALSMAAASLLLYALLRRWLELRRTAAPAQTSDPPAAVLALAGALTFAWALGPWSHATVTEVYALELVIQLAVLLLASQVIHGGKVDRLWPLALLCGLGMSHHLLTLTLLPFLFAAAVTAAQARPPTLSSRLRLAGGVGGLFLAGLLPILYLPLRAASSPALNWGNPTTPGRLWWTLTGGEYLDRRLLAEQSGQPFTFTGLAAHLTRRLPELAQYLAGQIAAPEALPDGVWLAALGVGAVLLVLGGVWLYRRRPTFFYAWTAALALYLAVLLGYNIRDIRDYQLGFFALLWPVTWIGLLEIGRRAPARLPALRAAIVLALPLTLLVANYPLADRSGSVLADLYARRLLANLPPRAILLTAGDYATATAWYQQEVEGERRDVLVFCLNFLYADWYGHNFRQPDPWGRRIQVSRRTPNGAEAFVSELRRLVIEPNLDRFPIFLPASRRQIRVLSEHYRLEPGPDLLTDSQYGAALAAGVRPPMPRLYQIVEKGENQKSSAAVGPLEK